mmetsp:Transcript_69326/g.137017  ORF Transcript_69326/g.137017 Transcript_69326/m.137017 type:complete len:294 (-) Transcript_69326:1631-2512(-)
MRPVKISVKSSAVSWTAVSNCRLHRCTTSSFPSFLAIVSSTRTDCWDSKLFLATRLMTFHTDMESWPAEPRCASACSTTARGVMRLRCNRASTVISSRWPESCQNSKTHRTTNAAKLAASSSSVGFSSAKTCKWPSSILLKCVGVFAPCCRTASKNNSSTDSNGQDLTGATPNSASSMSGCCLPSTFTADAGTTTAVSAPLSSSCFTSSFTSTFCAGSDTAPAAIPRCRLAAPAPLSLAIPSPSRFRFSPSPLPSSISATCAESSDTLETVDGMSSVGPLRSLPGSVSATATA